MIFFCKPNRVRRTYLGGSRIDRLRGANAPDGFSPEEWVASQTPARNAGSTDVNEGLSMTDDGKYLRDLVPGTPFLLKLLDAAERLVIQAHPTVAFAKKAWDSDFGKAECWYVLTADKGAHVYLGFREGITRGEWIDCFEKQDIPRMLSWLHRIELHAGDVWYLDGGVPHAIGGNCLLAELQEPTDLMVVPERVTPSGHAIAEQRLHGGLGFERMFDCFDYTGYSMAELKRRYYRHPTLVTNAATAVIDRTLTDKFGMEEYRIDGSVVYGGPLPAVMVVLSGTGILTDGDTRRELHAGDEWLMTPGTEATVSGKLRVLAAHS